MGRIISLKEFEKKTGEEQRQRGISAIKPVTLQPVGKLTLEKSEEIPSPEKPMSELDLLNEGIETNYKEYLKLQKTLSEFDTSLSEIPDIMKPTIVANFNRGVNKLNSLIGTLQTDIQKRDVIYSTKKREAFIEKKQLEYKDIDIPKEPPADIGGALGISKPLDLDKINKYVAAPLKGVKHGIYSTPQAVGGLMRLVGENMQATEGTQNIFTGDEKKYKDLIDKKNQKPITNLDKLLVDKSQEIIIANREYLLKKELHPDMDDKVATWFFQLGSGFTSLVGAIGIAILTHSPHAAAVAFGMYQTGSMYQEAREEGVGVGKATPLAITAGVIEGALEYIGLQWLFTKFGGNFWVNRVLHAGLEGFQEFSQQLGENLVAMIGWDGMRNLFQGCGESASIGAVLGGGMSAITENIDKNMDLKGLTSEQKKGLIEAIVEKQLTAISEILPNLDPKTIMEKVKTDPDIQKAILGVFEAEQEVVTEAMKVEPKEPTELFKDIDAYTKTKEGHEFKVMRSGEEYPDSSRGGTWYEIETWEGKKSAYLEGQGQYGLPGVGGKTTIRKELILKNPYMFKIPETKAEGEIPIKLWEEVEEKTLPNKKGFFGKDAEKHFAKLEKEVSDTLKEKGYDGVILYEKVGINTYPKQIFDFKTEPKPPTTPEELEAKREMLREHGVKEELLTDEFVKIAKIIELPKADVTTEIVSKGLIEDLEKKWGKEVKLTKKEVLEKVEEPPKVPPIPPKEVALEEEPEFPKDVKIKDVYTIGETTPAKKVKGKVREITGQTKQDKILIAELDILDLVLKGEEKAAKKAFSEGKKEGIFKQKEHFKDVVDRAKERKAQKEYVTRLIKDINKLPTKNMALDYKDKIEAIKEIFDLKKRTQKTLHTREETAKFIEREMAEGNTELRIPQEEIDMIRKIPLNDMTIAELETVHDNIMSLAHIGKTKDKMIILADKRAKEKLIEQLTNTILAGEKITPKQKGYHTQVRTLKDRFSYAWNLYFVNIKLDEALFEELDGMKKDINWKILYKSVNDCTTQELKNHFGELENFQDFFEKNKIDFIKFLTDKKQYGDSEFTSAEKVGVYLASLDEDARRHIRREDTLDISDKDIKEVTDALTKEEKAWADYLTEYQLRQGDAIDKILINTEGKHLRRVKNRYPIQVLNDELNNDVVMDLEYGNPMRRGAYLEKGFLKARTKHATCAININSISNFLRDLARVEHWKAFTETTRDLNRIIFDPKFKATIIQKKSSIVYNNIVKWFKDAVDAKQGKMLSDADKVMMFLRTNAAISMLGINIVSSMRQLVSLCNATAEIGVPAILSGIRQVALDHYNTKQFVFSKDEQMKRRHYQFEQVFQEQMGQIMAGKTVEGISRKQAKAIQNKLKGKPELKKQMLFLIRMFDEFAVLSVWKGSYDLVMNKHRTGDGKSIKFTDFADLERQAIEYAGAVMRKTQPMVAPKDLPQWFRDGGVVQLFNMFQNQINKNWNYINHDIFKKLGAKQISPYTAGKRLLWGWFTPSILLGIITRGRPPKDWKEIVTDMTLYLGGGLFFIGAFFINAIRGYGGYTSPVLAFGSDIVKAATYKTMESKLKHSISVICKIWGIPYNQPYRTIDGLEDWINGETEDIRRLIWTKYVLGEEEKKKFTRIPSKPTRPSKLKPSKPKKPTKP